MTDCFKVNVIMPMLGGGTRVKGFQDTCKPLMILPDGELFFLKALSSLKNYQIDTLCLVVLKEYEKDFKELSNKIMKVSKCRSLIIISHEPTSTPIETVKIGIEKIQNELPIFILDCDIYSEIPLIKIENNSFGYLFYFHDITGNKSYIRLSDNHVIEVKEKQLISNNAIFGAYLFTSKKRLTSKLYQGDLKYISDLFRIAVEDGCYISATKLYRVINYGTIEEINEL